MAGLQELTERIAQAVEAGDPLPHSVKLDLKGDGVIHIDGRRVSNDDAPAELVVTISLADLKALGKRRLDPMTALMTKRMRMSDMSLAFSMQSKIQSLFAKAA